MGCGCKKRLPPGQILGNSASRVAVYQVLVSGEVVSEFSNHGEARAAAMTAGGRVRVTSKPGVVQ